MRRRAGRAAGALAILVAAVAARAEPVARFPEVGAAPAASGVVQSQSRPPVLSLSGAQELRDRARRLLEAGRMLEAIGAYSESIRLEPGDGATLLALGRLRARLGDQGEADLLFSAAARHADTAADALSERAHLRRAQGREAEALADLAAAVELEAGGAGHAEELAAWYVARRAWLPALALYRRAQPADLRMGPDRRARLQIRALGVLAAELDPVLAGRARGYSWTRRLLARLATR